MQRSLQKAVARRAITLTVSTADAARGLHALMAGLIHTWMLDPLSFKLVAVAQVAIRTYLRGLGQFVRPGAVDILMVKNSE